MAKGVNRIKAAEEQIDNVVTLFDADDAPVKRGCYAEQLALEFFRRAIAAYAGKRIDPDIFGPLVRNIADESCIYAFRDSLSKGKKDEFADSDGVRVLLSDIWNKPAYRTRCRRQLLAWASSTTSSSASRLRPSGYRTPVPTSSIPRAAAASTMRSASSRSRLNSVSRPGATLR